MPNSVFRRDSVGRVIISLSSLITRTKVILLQQHRQHEGDQRDGDRGQQRLHRHGSGLSPDLPQYFLILYLLFISFSQLARTSRGEAYSRLVPPLKESDRRDVEHREYRQPPPATDFREHQSAQDDQADSQRYYTADE